MIAEFFGWAEGYLTSWFQARMHLNGYMAF